MHKLVVRGRWAGGRKGTEDKFGKTALRVLDCLIREGEASATKLSDMTGIRERHLGRHTRKLLEAGLILEGNGAFSLADDAPSKLKRRFEGDGTNLANKKQRERHAEESRAYKERVAQIAAEKRAHEERRA